METELLSADDITRIEYFSEVTAQRWCRDIRLPAVKTGMAYRVRARDLDRWYEGKLLDKTLVMQ